MNIYKDKYLKYKKKYLKLKYGGSQQENVKQKLLKLAETKNVDLNDIKILLGDTDEKSIVNIRWLNSIKDPTNNNSLLHVAAKVGNLDIVKYLISIGININDYNKQGMSPLQIAAVNNKTEVMQHLISKGAPFFTGYMYNILWMASKDGKVGVIKVILENFKNIADKIKIKHREEDSIHIAIMNNKIKSVNLLVNALIKSADTIEKLDNLYPLFNSYINLVEEENKLREKMLRPDSDSTNIRRKIKTANNIMKILTRAREEIKRKKQRQEDINSETGNYDRDTPVGNIRKREEKRQ